MSTLFGQFDKFSEQMTGAGVDHFQAMLNSGYFPLIRKAVLAGLELPSRDEFAEFLGLGKLHPDLMELEGIVIPEDATIASLKTAGEYDCQSDYAKQYITDEHFKVTMTGSRRLCLAHFNKVVTSEHVEEVAKEMGYKVALASDLLCVGSHPEYRELQRQYPIIALGSSTVVDGDRRVPYLDRWGDERDLRLPWFGLEWHNDCRFLLVGKDTPSDA